MGISANVAPCRSAQRQRSRSPSAWGRKAAGRSFDTDFRYSDRQSKARYVWLKYGPILRGASILDVGADECYLRGHLDRQARYWGVGLGGSPDQEVDLECGQLPFADGSFDCVLCLDVIEHLEHAHSIFDELCRVTRRHVIVSLPNSWREFWAALRRQPYSPDRALKFYGLPCERPSDRHRWFFSASEARRFVAYRAAECGMTIVQMDHEAERPNTGWRGLVRRLKSIRLRRDLDLDDLYLGTLWAVLKTNDA